MEAAQGRAERSENRLVDRLTARVTRRGLLAGSGLAGTGLLASQIDLLRSAAQDSSAVRDVIDPAATIEAFAVTFVGVGRQRGGAFGIPNDAARFLRAAQCEDEAHYNYLAVAGAVGATSFTLSSRLFRDRATFLRTLLNAKELAVGTAMAAARQFAALGELRLVEIAYQLGAVEAQHLALTRLYLGEQVPSDRAFAQWRFASTADAAQALTDAGYLGGSGKEYAFPGPLSRQCRGVFGLIPETTEDQQEPPLASPVASPAGPGDGTTG